MAERSVVQIMLRATGGRQVRAEVGTASKSLGGLRRSAVGADSAAARMSKTLRNDVSRAMGATVRAAQYAAVGIAGVGVAAAKMGLEFNASMEQNRVAFKYFLGDAQTANAYINDLYQLAAKTPFEFQPLAHASRQLMAFGFSAEDAYTSLARVGDAVSALGTGQEGISRIVLALGQMKSAGVVQGDELRQFQEAGINVYRYLVKAGLMTKKDIGQVGLLHIRSGKALDAIMSGLQKDFAGMTKVQQKTLRGQLSTLKDYTSRTLGTMTEPLFESLRDDVLPALNDTATRVNEIFGNDSLSDAEKWRRSWNVAARKMEPFVDSMMKGLRRADLDDKLADAIEWAAPKMADAAASAAPKAAKAFVNAWLEMGPWGKLITGAMLVKHLGLIPGGQFEKAGKKAGNKFGRAFILAAATLGIWDIMEGEAGLPPEAERELLSESRGMKRGRPTGAGKTRTIYRGDRWLFQRRQDGDWVTEESGARAGGRPRARGASTAMTSQSARHVPAIVPTESTTIRVPVNIDGKPVTEVVAKHKVTARERNR